MDNETKDVSYKITWGIVPVLYRILPVASRTAVKTVSTEECF